MITVFDQRDIEVLDSLGEKEIVSLDQAEVRKVLDVHDAKLRFDDDKDVLFLARELQAIKARTYDIKFAELKAANGALFPISNEGGNWAESITYRQHDMRGSAKLMANYGDDSPRSDISRKEFSVLVRPIRGSFGYSIQEIRAAQANQTNLTQMKARSAKRSIDQEIQRIALFGDSEHGLNGFITHPDITSYTLPNDGSGSSTKFVDKTPDQVLRDLHAMSAQVNVTSNGVFSADTLLLPLSVYEDIKTRRIQDQPETILNFFLKTATTIRNVEPLNELTVANSQGNLTLDTAIMYKRDPEMLTLELPVMFQVHARIGGMNIPYPLAVIKAEGV
jgi:hypothetical protein